MTRAPAKGGEDLPVAVDVAVPVQAAGEAGAGEVFDVEVDVGPGQPPRQRRQGCLAARSLGGGARHHAEGRRAGWSIAGQPHQDTLDGGADVMRQFGVGHAGGLEMQLVEHRVLGLRHHRGGPCLAARAVGHAKADDRAEPVGAQQRGVPGDRGAPVMAGDDRRLGPQRVEHAHHVAHQMEQGVLVDGLWALGLAVAAHVGGDGAVAGLRQGVELVAPGIPGLREAVAEQHQRAAAFLGDVHADAVGLDQAVLDVGHGLCSPEAIKAGGAGRRQAVRAAAGGPPARGCGAAGSCPRGWAFRRRGRGSGRVC